MIKRLAFPITGLVVVALTIVAPLNSQQAFAATTDLAPKCANTNLEGWNWPDAIKNSTAGSPAGAGLTDFDPTNSSYIIFQVPTYYPDRANYELWYAGSGSKLTFSYNSGVSKPQLTVTGGSLDGAHIISEPVTNPTYKAIWGSFTSNYSPVYSTAYHSLPPSSPWYFDSSQMSCMYTAHNVGYDPSFLDLYNKFSSSVQYQIVSGQTCSSLNVGCWISKALSGISDTFVGWFEAAANFIGNLFIPNESDLADSWNNFSTFMQGKLGFLTYPFTFVIDVFDAFTTSTSGCTSSSCTYDFGNFYGHDFSVNFLAPKLISPSLFNYLLLVIQSLTVIALVYEVHKKYLEVVKS